MSSDQEKMYNSSDNEGRKRHAMHPAGEDKAAKGLDDVHDIKGGPMRYYPAGPAQQPMMHRTPGEPGLRPGPMMQPSRSGVSEDSDLTDAMVFLNRIKEEYADALPVYDSFLETMRDFKFGKIDADEVCKAVRILFKDKPFLVRQFDDYLPHHLRYNESRGYSQTAIPDRQGYQPYRAPPYIAGQPHAMGRMMPGQHMPLGRPGYPQYPPVFMGRHTSPPAPPQPGIPKAPRPLGPEQEASKHRLANDFIQLVKKKYAAKPMIYKQFIELLQNSKSGFDKLLSQVSALLVDTPELVERFERNFRPAPDHDDGYASESDPLKAIKDQLAEKGVLGDFLKILNFYNQCYISADDLVFMLDPIVGDKENMKAFKGFIKYEEPSVNYDPKKFKDYEKMGSYKIYPQPITLNTSSALAREVLNNMCLSVSILESEDGYIFRNKNSSEELLAKVNDERSEADLNLDRLRYLISKLEELYANLGDNQLEMDDIEMSAALIKETLRRVYESRSNEMLEAILSNPKKAIPVVLSRLHRVYKENLAVHRQRRKFWRSQINENYYKAYDTKGVLFRSDEKNVLSLKYIYSEARTPLTVQFSDSELVAFVKRLFASLVTEAGGNASRRMPAEEQTQCFNEAFERLLAGEAPAVFDFDHYALYVYIMTVYARFSEAKTLLLEPLSANPMAVEIGYQAEFSIPDRFAELLRISELLVAKAIDSDTYEEHVRELTDSRGFKLYNLRKILSRVEKQVHVLLERRANEEGEPAFPGAYMLSRDRDIVTVCLVEDGREAGGSE